jgi:hypothetical protein
LKEAKCELSPITKQEQKTAINLGGLLLIISCLLVILPKMQGTVLLSIAVFSLIYGVAYFTIPALRYLILLFRNRQIVRRNQSREQRAIQLQHDSAKLRHKLTYAKQFATETEIMTDKIIYTTEKDLLDQE